MNKIMVFIFCFCVTSSCWAQTSSKLFVQQQLDSLQQYGAVIVLLKGTTRAMEAYQKAGQTKVVQEMTKKTIKSIIYSSTLLRTNGAIVRFILCLMTISPRYKITLKVPYLLIHDYSIFLRLYCKKIILCSWI